MVNFGERGVNYTMQNEPKKIQVKRCPECGSSNVLSTVSTELSSTVDSTEADMTYYQCKDCENAFMCS
jgi:uncharacterized protein with PIN domain